MDRVRGPAPAIAAASGRPAIVSVPIARGASLVTRPGRPSLVVSAAIEGHREVVDVLVAAGAEIDIFAACALGDVHKVDALLTDKPSLVHARTEDSKTPLHFARTEDVAERLIRAGAALNVEDDSGQTPLQWMAATGRYKSLVSYLKSQGARAESSDIFWACVYGDIAAVRTFSNETGPWLMRDDLTDPGFIRYRSALPHCMKQRFAERTRS